MTNTENKSEVEAHLKRAADTTSNIKTIVAAVAGIAVGVFFAGIYWSQLHKKIDDAYEYGVTNNKAIGVINASVAALVQFKDDLKLWGKVPDKPPNWSGPSGGSGNQPTQCPDGSYMVGIESSSNIAPPACIGCLTGVRAICRSLKTQ